MAYAVSYKVSILQKTKGGLYIPPSANFYADSEEDAMILARLVSISFERKAVVYNAQFRCVATYNRGKPIRGGR